MRIVFPLIWVEPRELAVDTGLSPDGRVSVVCKSWASPGPRLVTVKPKTVIEPTVTWAGDMVSGSIVRFAFCSVICPVFGSIQRGSVGLVIGVSLRIS